jgi:MFS family permease
MLEPPSALPAPSLGSDVGEQFERAVLRKVSLRLLPFLGLMYLLNILDRNNVGFARLRMQTDLDMSEYVYSLAAGVFFMGYSLFQVPSNLILNRIGARRWLAIILIAWGLISACTLAVTGPWSFMALRFLLGLAEAGFFPGILLYLTYWFPARQRAQAASRFLIASPLVLVGGAPLSGALMQYMNENWPAWPAGNGSS